MTGTFYYTNLFVIVHNFLIFHELMNLSPIKSADVSLRKLYDCENCSIKLKLHIES